MWAPSICPRVIFPVNVIPRPDDRRTISANAQPPNQGQGDGEGGNQLKGLDVLLAMQRAAAEKNRASGSGGGSGGGQRNSRRKRSGRKVEQEEEVDFSNVKPLFIKKEWSTKLVDLGKRLEELSQTK